MHGSDSKKGQIFLILLASSIYLSISFTTALSIPSSRIIRGSQLRFPDSISTSVHNWPLREKNSNSSNPSNPSPQKTDFLDINASQNERTATSLYSRRKYPKSFSTKYNDIKFAEKGSSSISRKIIQISSLASLLCLIDCTLIPIATILLPIVGLNSVSIGNIVLHDIGHAIALWFVLPVGGITTLTNMARGGKKNLSFLAMIGLFFIYITNSHGIEVLDLLPTKLLYSLQCGTILHPLINLLGCVLLFLSNFYNGRKACRRQNQTFLTPAGRAGVWTFFVQIWEKFQPCLCYADRSENLKLIRPDIQENFFQWEPDSNNT